MYKTDLLQKTARKAIRNHYDYQKRRDKKLLASDEVLVADKLKAKLKGRMNRVSIKFTSIICSILKIILTTFYCISETFRPYRSLLA